LQSKLQRGYARLCLGHHVQHHELSQIVIGG
jgi:hypothetical protein